MGQARWVLSGGLASGKSKVREALERSGVMAIDADSIGHSVLQPEAEAYLAVAERWPTVVRGGQIDRGLLASIVFGDPDELAALEEITHPHIFDTILARVELVESVIVVEVPLLRHGLGNGWKRIVMDCRDEVKLERAVSRGMSRSDAYARIANQPTRTEWLAVADLVVPNHGSIQELDETVYRLLESGILTAHSVRSTPDPPGS